MDDNSIMHGIMKRSVRLLISSDFISESELSYFKALTICLLLVYFVSAAGCHCFEFHTDFT